MTIENIRKFCSLLPAVTEDIKWENHLCFSVGSKIFLILGLNEHPVTASFKTDADTFALLLERAGFAPARYLGRYQWIGVEDTRLMKPDEWKSYIQQSYHLIARRLPAGTRRQLGLG